MFPVENDGDYPLQANLDDIYDDVHDCQVEKVWSQNEDNTIEVNFVADGK